MNYWLSSEKIKEINNMAKIAHEDYNKTKNHSESSKKLVTDLHDLIKFRVKKSCGNLKDKIDEYIGSGYHAAYKAIETYDDKYDFHQHMISNIKFYVRGDYLRDIDSKMIIKFTSRVLRSHGKKYKKFLMNSEVSHLSDDEKIYKYATDNDLSVASVRQIHDYFRLSSKDIDDSHENNDEFIANENIKTDNIIFLKKVIDYVKENFSEKEIEMFSNYFTEVSNIETITNKYGISRQYYYIIVNKMISKIKKKFKIN